MVQLGVFSLLAGVPVFLFLRRIRALGLSRGYALVLTVPIVLGLWTVIQIIISMGRL